MAVHAAVVITTKNRRDDLRRALVSALAQVPPVEVLVMDDGSADGTAEMVHCEFPGARLERSEQSEGYIVQRNRAARLAGSPFVVSIDDDAEFSSPDIVAATVRLFDDPRVGAVAIPCIDVNSSPAPRWQAPDGGDVWVVASYVGTAHAVRRELFLELGGYREFLFHQGKEEDLGIRLLDRGYVVRAGYSQPILHYQSPKRDRRRLHVMGPRNLVLFAWWNVPWPWLPFHLMATSGKAMLHGLRIGKPLLKFRGTAAGYLACLKQLRGRAPVSSDAYRFFRRLKKTGPLRLKELERLPSIAAR